MEWYWWLLILLAVLVVLWLLMRARQGSSASRPDAADRAPGAGGRAAAGGADEVMVRPAMDDSGSGSADVAGDASGPDVELRGFASTAGLSQPETTAAPSGPYGEGSAAPTADGTAPAGYSIKGNIDSMLYHTPGGRWYDITVAEVWFGTVADAQSAGFSAPPDQGSSD